MLPFLIRGEKKLHPPPSSSVKNFGKCLFVPFQKKFEIPKKNPLPPPPPPCSIPYVQGLYPRHQLYQKQNFLKFCKS